MKVTTNTNFFKTANNKTNKLTKFLLICFLCLVPLVVAWIILGQFNLLGLNWLIAQNAKYFISNAQINEINNHITNPDLFLKLNQNFYIWRIGENEQYQATLQVIANYGHSYIFSNWWFLIFFGVLAVNLIVYLPLIFCTNKVYLDIFPMFLATWTGILTLIVTGLIPQDQAYTIPVQIIVIVVVFISVLLLTSYIFSIIIANSKWANPYYEKLKSDEKEAEYYYQTYLETKQKLKQKDETTITLSDEDEKK